MNETTRAQRLNPDRTPKPGTYRAVLADPPWSMHQKGKFGAAEHYELMNDDRILEMGRAIHAVASENSFCFLWVTTATLPLGIQVLAQWGYRYSSFYFWAKPVFGLGNTFRNAGELLLLGIRGSEARFAYRSQPNWGFYPRQDHSHKPEEIHSMIERVVGEGPYLELFARRPAPTRGDWDVWGDEVDSSEPSLISLKKWGYPVPGDPLEFADAPDVETP